MGKSGKEPVLAALHHQTERYAGGVLAIANHISNFCDQVGLLSCTGEINSCEEFIASKMNQNVTRHFIRVPGAPTIIKRRFLEEYLAVKLFEVYEMKTDGALAAVEERFCRELERLVPQYDVVLVADYGHGVMSERAVELVCARSKFLAVNTQVNAGNRGFNTISKYPRANYICISENELRQDCRTRQQDLRQITEQTAKRLDCSRVTITRGERGCLCYERDQGFFEIPAFTSHIVDRVGAGDAVFAVTSLCAAREVPMEVIGFTANIVGAQAVTVVANQRPVDPVQLMRHIEIIMM
jgi:bifunctional ADP-heptose synthase (sugar kinase/adenylyltransferase)